MRHTILILLGFLQGITSLGQNFTDYRFVDTVGLPPGIDHFAYEHISRNSSTVCECWDIELIILKNGQQVNAVAEECLDEYHYAVRIEYTCDDNELQEVLTDFRIHINFEENNLETFTGIGGNPLYYFYGPLSDLLEGMGTPNQFRFEVIVERTFMGVGISECSVPLDFDYLSTEGHYYTKVYIDWNGPVHFEEFEGGCDPTGISRKDMACCNADNQILWQWDNSVYHSEEYSLNGEICIKTEGNIGASLPGGSASISAGFSSEVCVEAKRIEGINDVESKRQDIICKGDAGRCRYFGAILVYRELVIEKYKVSCSDYDPIQELETERRRILTEISPQCCELVATGCPQLVPNYFDPQGTMDGNLVNDCQGRIELNNTYPDPITIEWSGPHGFSSSEENIDGLDPGLYNYTIRNQCCEEITGVVELCVDPVQGEWSFVASKGQYCRLVQCDDYAATLKRTNSTCEYEECITPDEVIPEIENGFCIEKDYYEGELLGTRIISEVKVEVEYDEEDEKCITSIYCGGNLFQEIEEDPDFEDWEYDADNRECIRIVICFDKEFEEIYDDPDLEEVYDERYHECEIRVDCKGEEIEYETEPYDETDWKWSEYRGCTRTVECIRFGEKIDVEGEESFDNTEYSEGSDICISEVYCDGDYVSGETKYSTPDKSAWFWEVGRSECERRLYCPYSNETYYEYIDPSFVETGSYCPDNPSLMQYMVYCDGQDMNITTCFRNVENRMNDIPNSNSQEIELYPNPFNDKINIFPKSGILKSYSDYKIYNVNGVLVLEGMLLHKVIDASKLEPGIYQIHIFGTNGAYTQDKIIKF